MLASPEYRSPAAIHTISKTGFAAERIFLPQVEPAWKAAAFKRLDEIRNLPKNWDGYGSPAISTALISRVASLVKAIPDDHLPRGVPWPVISPASDGMQIEWNGGHGGVEVILHPDGTGAFVVEFDGKYEDGQLYPSDTFAVVSLLRRVFDESGTEYQPPSDNNFRGDPGAVSPSLRIAAA